MVKGTTTDRGMPRLFPKKSRTTNILSFFIHYDTYCFSSSENCIGSPVEILLGGGQNKRFCLASSRPSYKFPGDIVTAGLSLVPAHTLIAAPKLIDSCIFSVPK